jgi:4-amino-4-deoxy-L-arabinose transferase-like glycosyltransferase
LTTSSRSHTDWLLILGFCGFLFFFGLNSFGLIGADEPRYAQIAREMLARHDWVTPILGGNPWLEKPPLYYWQAMLSYRIFGVSDWAARIPSAMDATFLVIAVYLFLRRFHPGFQLDGALITASAAGIIGFARAASTDMPLAATFGIAMLAWYAWFESRSRAYLAVFYVFLALGTLAKGPVAPVLAALIILLYAAARRDYGIVWRTLWIPGPILFFLVALPWYILVQLRNPEFFRIFILQHNLARFGTDLYHHQQPFWYYVPVTLLALIPWVIFVAESGIESLRIWWHEGKATVAGDEALNFFLLLWLATPVFFFSLSRSKLPGYILPALPAGTLLVAEYIRRHVVDEMRPSWLVIVLHSLIAAAPMVPALMIQYILVQHRLAPGPALWISLLATFVIAVAMAATLHSTLGLRMLRLVTLVPVILVVAAVLRIGGPRIDESFSARPLANEISRVEQGLLQAAIFHVPREVEYGLAFYRNQAIENYDRGEIPQEAHLLVTTQAAERDIHNLLGSRRVSLLGTYPPQNLEYFWVAAASAPAHDMENMPGMKHGSSN